MPSGRRSSPTFQHISQAMCRALFLLLVLASPALALRLHRHTTVVTRRSVLTSVGVGCALIASEPRAANAEIAGTDTAEAGTTFASDDDADIHMIWASTFMTASLDRVVSGIVAEKQAFTAAVLVMSAAFLPVNEPEPDNTSQLDALSPLDDE